MLIIDKKRFMHEFNVHTFAPWQLEDTRRVNRKNKDVKMFASPLEHAAQHSLAKGMASRYEEQL